MQKCPGSHFITYLVKPGSTGVVVQATDQYQGQSGIRAMISGSRSEWGNNSTASSALVQPLSSLYKKDRYVSISEKHSIKSKICFWKENIICRKAQFQIVTWEVTEHVCSYDCRSMYTTQ